MAKILSPLPVPHNKNVSKKGLASRKLKSIKFIRLCIYKRYIVYVNFL